MESWKFIVFGKFFPILQYFNFSWFLRFSSKFFLIFQINFRKIKLFQLKVMKIIADFFKFSLFIWKIFWFFLILWFLFRKIKKNSTKFFKYSFYILYFYLENSKKINIIFQIFIFQNFQNFKNFQLRWNRSRRKKNVFLFFYFSVRSIPILSFPLLFGSSGPLSEKRQ